MQSNSPPKCRWLALFKASLQWRVRLFSGLLRFARNDVCGCKASLRHCEGAARSNPDKKIKSPISGDCGSSPQWRGWRRNGALRGSAPQRGKRKPAGKAAEAGGRLPPQSSLRATKWRGNPFLFWIASLRSQWRGGVFSPDCFGLAALAMTIVFYYLFTRLLFMDCFAASRLEVTRRGFPDFGVYQK
jgi:hypothetical protein